MSPARGPAARCGSARAANRASSAPTACTGSCRGSRSASTKGPPSVTAGRRDPRLSRRSAARTPTTTGCRRPVSIAARPESVYATMSIARSNVGGESDGRRALAHSAAQDAPRGASGGTMDGPGSHDTGGGRGRAATAVTGTCRCRNVHGKSLKPSRRRSRAGTPTLASSSDGGNPPECRRARSAAPSPKHSAWISSLATHGCFDSTAAAAGEPSVSAAGRPRQERDALWVALPQTPSQAEVGEPRPSNPALLMAARDPCSRVASGPPSGVPVPRVVCRHGSELQYVRRSCAWLRGIRKRCMSARSCASRSS
jgi:hypothetical protein